MNAIDYGTKHTAPTEEMLTHPQLVLPMLFDGSNSEFMIYTHDMNHRLTYLSDSSWDVCRLSFKNWENKSIEPMLTDNPCNELCKSPLESVLEPNQIQKTYCEIRNDEGELVKLEVRRRLIVVDGEPIGVIGLTNRVQDIPSATPTEKMDCFEFFEKLSIGEVEVIKLVIDGQLNKTIAKKLGVAIRTVEARRSKAMTKLGVATVPDLVKLWCSFQNQS
jgi:DNA-binding CsgD family transcriptional regulator